MSNDTSTKTINNHSAREYFTEMIIFVVALALFGVVVMWITNAALRANGFSAQLSWWQGIIIGAIIWVLKRLDERW